MRSSPSLEGTRPRLWLCTRPLHAQSLTLRINCRVQRCCFSGLTRARCHDAETLTRIQLHELFCHWACSILAGLNLLCFAARLGYYLAMSFAEKLRFYHILVKAKQRGLRLQESELGGHKCDNKGSADTGSLQERLPHSLLTCFVMNQGVFGAYMGVV